MVLLSNTYSIEFSMKVTTVELELDVREYLMHRATTEGRTLKWLINNAVRKEMLTEQAVQRQPELALGNP